MSTVTLIRTAEPAHATLADERTIIDTINALDKGIFIEQIHDNPELCFAEFEAHNNIIALIESQGIPVMPHAYGLETSFSAEYGSGGRVIGHGCGHNLIATSAIAGFLGTVSAIKQSGRAGRVRLLGTTAEEGWGGKIKLINAGAFLDVDAAMMSHPFPVGPATRAVSGVAYGNCLAVLAFRATFEGKAAHAAFSPWPGANALDAVTLTYTAESINIISERTIMSCNVRAKTLKETMDLLDRVHKCLEGAALATGCTLKIETIHDPYADLRPNKTLCSIFTDTMLAFKRTYKCDLDNIHDGSYGTDMGNVSYNTSGSTLHSTEFAAAARTGHNHEITIQVAKGMALTAWKVLSDDAVAMQVKADFEQDILLR
ncbi:hypothetical protein GQ53DRAFT_789775 [Thozetella sp. PMI_491]|nr:hypothetical protein GQ53DRAFT_789775 [Thozetella sp. PMI_491]